MGGLLPHDAGGLLELEANFETGIHVQYKGGFVIQVIQKREIALGIRDANDRANVCAAKPTDDVNGTVTRDQIDDVLLNGHFDFTVSFDHYR